MMKLSRKLGGESDGIMGAGQGEVFFVASRSDG